ncbi:MAG: 30S ribosomal protein S1 [Bacillota bacterium]|nr:30S ribosomal protein S1 [Bacillota bacterium]
MVDGMEHLTEVKTLAPGDIVRGRVTKVEDKQVLVDVGYKVDGILPIRELSNVHVEKPSDVVQVGEEVEVKVLKVNDEADELIVSKRAVDAERAWERLARALETGEILEARVADVVKGGLVVDVGVRGFVPASHVERHFVKDFSDYKGRTLRLKVIELDREKNKAVLSHKAVLEEEDERRKQEVFSRLKPGDVVEGTVQRLTDFGAFVDVGGMDGLVHVSEIAWHHVDKPADVLQEGQRVTVKVLKLDPAAGRISLSIKATQPSPWEQAGEMIHPGDVREGVVKRLVSFGAFVELMPGVEGLVHISQIANRHIATPHEVLKEGETVKVKVLDVNIPEKRISLSIRALQEEDRPLDRRERQDFMGGGFNLTLGDVIGDQLRKLK